MNYGEVITLAGKLLWWHKHLWVLGLVIALLSGNCGGVGSSFNFPGTPGGQFEEDDVAGGPSGPLRWLSEIDPAVLIGTFLALLVGLLLLGLVWFLAWLILRPVARGGIAYSVSRLADGQPSGFGVAWGGAWRRKGSLVGIVLLLEFLPGLLLVILIAGLIVWILAPIIAAGSDFGDAAGGLFAASLATGIVAICCLVVLAIPTMILLGVLTELSSIAAVLEQRSAGRAIGRAWQLMRNRPGPLAVIWFVTVAVGMVLGTIAAMPALAIALLFVLPLLGSDSPPLGLWVLAGFFLTLAGLFGLVMTSWVTAYSTSLWTLAFRRLTDSLTGGTPERALRDAV